jgi:hypothetical protein|tara:strand:+ start:1960 stop:2280 length:321 start_codon:yes stop_codon:yes gene_type:complete
MENEDSTQQTSMYDMVNGPVLLFTILLTLGVLIMLPTASALYYSKCLNVTLLMGFGIVFSSLITALFSMLLPGVMRGYLRNTTFVAWGFVTIYAVIVQIMGGCKFS